MSYHAVTLGPSDGQMSDLAEGRTVLLQHSDFQGDVTFHLTKSQMARIQKAHAAGRGCKLQLSASQVKMMAQKGTGRFSDYLRQGYDFMKPSLRAGLAKGRQLAEHKVSGVLSAAERRVAKAAGLEGEGFLRDIAHAGIDVVGNHIGVGLPKQKGKGFLRDIAHAGVDVIGNHVGVGLPKPKKGVAVAQAGSGWLSNATFGLVGDGANMRPARPPRQQGKGFLRDIAHAGVDVIGNHIGGAVPNPLANPNEGLRGALFQKKVVVSGAGLRQ